jgi:hypothetical protein
VSDAKGFDGHFEIRKYRESQIFQTRRHLVDERGIGPIDPCSNGLLIFPFYLLIKFMALKESEHFIYAMVSKFSR